MLTAHQRQARRVAARWSLKQAEADWAPKIPKEILARLAYLPNTLEYQNLDDARDSVAVFIPKILKMLRQVQGDRYYMNASESRGRIFYFFSPRQPIDAFSLSLWMKGEKANLSFGFMPYKLDGTLDFQKALHEHAVSEPELAGLTLMRLVRSVLATKARLKLGRLL